MSAVAPERLLTVYGWSRKHHPVLQYLPTKLAEWIGENVQDELGFSKKKDPNKLSVSELNDMLRTHVRLKQLLITNIRMP